MIDNFVILVTCLAVVIVAWRAIIADRKEAWVQSVSVPLQRRPAKVFSGRVKRQRVKRQ
jgi:hypothetical protein